MLRRFGRGLLWGTAGYIVGAIATYGLIMLFSSNVHDRDVEAPMTAAFFGGPLIALIAFVAGALRQPRTGASE
jgi:hypothetical protein